jgi:hypothetical protein
MTPEEYLHTAFCNGLQEVRYWGFKIRYVNKEYDLAADYYRSRHMMPCYEDVLMRILECGGRIKFVDLEGDMSTSLTKEKLHENFKYVPQRVIDNMNNEHDDAEDADIFLQCILFKEITFG